jgi:hypothetical protein
VISVTSRHRRSTPLIRLLVRLGWQRDPELWTVPCRDLDGREAQLLIRLSPSGITITTTAAGPLHLTTLQVGQLRVAAYDAIQTCGLLTTSGQAESPPGGGRAAVPSAPLARTPTRREVVPYERPTRPTVPELCARHQAPSTHVAALGNEGR